MRGADPNLPTFPPPCEISALRTWARARKDPARSPGMGGDFVYARRMARIAIVGGGLAGLCAAHRLSRLQHRVLIVESAARLGGQIHTEHQRGYTVELGAEG